MNALPQKPAEASSLLLAKPVALIFLVCSAPFAWFYRLNLDDGLRATDIVPYALATFAVFSSVYLVLYRLLRPRTYRLASVIAVFVIMFFNYYEVTRLFDALGADRYAQALGWGALAVAALVVATALGGRVAFQQFLLLFAMANLATPLFLSLTQGSAPVGPGLRPNEAYPLEGNPIWSGRPLRKPNIYWIVSDSYPNETQLRDYYHFDNSAFLDTLRSKGFYVASDSYANFNNTSLSVPTTLNMEYVFEESERFAIERNGELIQRPGRTNRTLLDTLSGDNRTVSFLKQIGYRYVHFEGAVYLNGRCRGYEDVCIRNKRRVVSELETRLLQLIPSKPVLKLLPGLRTLVEAKNASGTGIPELAEDLAVLEVQEPFFLYAHITAPHPPVRNDAECRLLPYDPDRKGPGPFVDQVKCVNRQLTALLSQILADDPEAIIMLSSDHGPRMSTRESGTRLDDLSLLQVRENLGILNALYLPDDCRRHLHPDITPINSMRLIFACLGGHPPRFIEPRHFAIQWGPDAGRIRRVDPHSASVLP
jgi:hypothetical protein